MLKKTKKIVLLILSFFLFLASIISAVSTTSQHVKNVKNIDNGYKNFSLELTFNSGEFEFEIVKTEFGLFASIVLPGAGFNYHEGKAKLPTIRRFVEIPYEANPVITITKMSWDYTSLEKLNLPIYIVPCQSSSEKIPKEQQEFLFDEDFYLLDSFFPEDIVKIDEIGYIRARRLALIEISPVQYNPSTGELKLMNFCEIKIDFQNSNMIETREKIERYYSPTYEKLFEHIFINYKSFEKELLNRKQECYLIIIDDAFYDEIQPLANFKEYLDFDVKITKTSEIPGGSNKESITNYIEDAYYNWNNPPVFILLVGDTQQIPTFTGSASPTATDLYYVAIDGNDYFPDINIGRFPASEEIHVETMVEKTLYYEIGNFTSNDWIKKASFMASTEYHWISEETHNFVIDNYLNPSNYSCDKLYSYRYGATTQDIHDAVNDGRSLVVFSGHGIASGWTDGPPFDRSDVKDLMNENMYPFVCSHACYTNSFDQIECFGETWLREEDKAAFAFWGSSAKTYWDEDDILEKGMFQAWWDDGLEWIGGMTDMALLYLFENYSGGGFTKYYFEVYNIIGDPSVLIWSDNPNRSPYEPDKPNGPLQGLEKVDHTFSANTTDPEDNNIFYQFDWGNDVYSKWYGPFNSSVTVEATYAWGEPGEYEVCVWAKDVHDKKSDWSEPHIITILDNKPPSAPTMQGKRVVKTGEPYDLTISSKDPEGHNVSYYIDWGDGDIEYWLGPYNSGKKVTFSHYFNDGGTLTINTTARDELFDESPEQSLKIFIIKNRIHTSSSFQQVFTRIFDIFPILKQILTIL